MIREKRRRKKRMKKVIIAFLIFLLLAVLSAFVVVKVFVVKTVRVEGNKLYDEQLIKDTVLNDEYSWNSLYVFLKYTFTDAQEVPFIDEMEIRLNSPQMITIKVYEKGILGAIQVESLGETAYFDKDGFVVETSNRVIENVPDIRGLSCENIVLYEKLPMENQQLRDLLTLTQALKRDALVPDAVQYETEHAPILYYGDVRVQLGSMELLTQKVERLKEILPQLDTLAGVLHMENWTEESKNIIFEKDEPAQEPEEEGQEPQDDVPN